MVRKPTATVILSLRIREELRREIEKAAKVHRVSMNAEIIDRLQRSFLQQNLGALLREQVEIGFAAAVKKLRDE